MANRDHGTLAKEWFELEASGTPLEPMEFRVGVEAGSAGSGVTIRNGRDSSRNEIRQLKGSQFAYILSVFIRCDRPGKIIIQDSWIATPWDDPCIEWLEDPTIERRHPGWYSFPGDTEQFAREEVLNHRINGVLSRGDIREGFLLAVGLRPPETFKNHEKIPITFRLVDQWDCRHSAELHVTMTRFSTRAKETNKSARGSLFSRPDFITPSCSLVDSETGAVGVDAGRPDEDSAMGVGLARNGRRPKH
jgi:hypothetical protein